MSLVIASSGGMSLLWTITSVNLAILACSISRGILEIESNRQVISSRNFCCWSNLNVWNNVFRLSRSSTYVAWSVVMLYFCFHTFPSGPAFQVSTYLIHLVVMSSEHWQMLRTFPSPPEMIFRLLNHSVLPVTMAWIMFTSLQHVYWICFSLKLKIMLFYSPYRPTVLKLLVHLFPAEKVLERHFLWLVILEHYLKQPIAHQNSVLFPSKRLILLLIAQQGILTSQHLHEPIDSRL